MDFFDFKNIAERNMEIVNPTTPEKLLEVGRLLGLAEGDRVIDFGCGYAEALVLWAENFGISGVGVDVRPAACERAEQKLHGRGLSDRIEIVCGKGADYAFEEGSFDAATCIGATFVWRGFLPSVRAMKRAIRPGGRLAIGEAYWLSDDVPHEYATSEPEIHQEHRLLEWTREEGFDVEAVVRATTGEWDHYESGNWRGLLAWLGENPDHPERREVIDHLRESQDEYFRYTRSWVGWAMYVLLPTE
jgi:SAM-dependent methyltransferase